MKVSIFWGILLVPLCILSGFIGAYSMVALRQGKTQTSVVQTQKLELIGPDKNVRAVLSVENNGGVFLRMYSGTKVPIVELGVSENAGGERNVYAPSGRLSLFDATGKPAVQLRVKGKSESSLTFASPSSEGQVEVGYANYGDVVDEHDRGIWGLEIVEPNHNMKGIGVFAEDGVLKDSHLKLEPPSVEISK
jgi:hypothetical protein